MPRKTFQHGLSAYTNRRCSCPVCTEAHTAYHRAYMAARPDQREKHRARERARRRTGTN